MLVELQPEVLAFGGMLHFITLLFGKAGGEPARALNSLLATLMMNAPSTRPMISGRTYCTFAALCKAHCGARNNDAQMYFFHFLQFFFFDC